MRYPIERVRPLADYEVDRAEVWVQWCMELTVTNRSRACPRRYREEEKRTDDFNMWSWGYVCRADTSYIYSSIAQSVEHAAVNRAVVGSSPTRGVLFYLQDKTMKERGPMVKRLRHRPFTAVTRVRISLGSFWWHSQAVRRGSATPWSPVQIWLSPLRNHRNVVPFFVVKESEELKEVKKSNLIWERTVHFYWVLHGFYR